MWPKSLSSDLFNDKLKKNSCQQKYQRKWNVATHTNVDENYEIRSTNVLKGKSFPQYANKAAYTQARQHCEERN